MTDADRPDTLGPNAKQMSGCVCVETDAGVFFTRDGGLTWRIYGKRGRRAAWWLGSRLMRWSVRR